MTVAGTNGAADDADFVYSGRTLTFTAVPADGWERVNWTGDCAGVAENVCAFAATTDVSVGAVFRDIDECQTKTRACAAAGGICTNTTGGFACHCAAGYSGDGMTCDADKLVLFRQSANGTLSAAGAGASIRAGQTVTHGTTVTFTAEPAYGYRLSLWLGDCAGDFDLSCEVAATLNVSVGAVFTNMGECVTSADCAADGGRCEDAGGVFDCVCDPGHSGDGLTCEADKLVLFRQSANGTLSAAGAGGAVEDGETTAHGTRLTFTAKPNPGWQIYAWLGDCVDTAATLTACEVTATLDVSVGVTFTDINECATSADNNCAAAGGICTNTGGRLCLQLRRRLFRRRADLRRGQDRFFSAVPQRDAFGRGRGGFCSRRRDGGARNDDNLHRRAGLRLSVFRLVRRLRRGFVLPSCRNAGCQRGRDIHRH